LLALARAALGKVAVRCVLLQDTDAKAECQGSGTGPACGIGTITLPGRAVITTWQNVVLPCQYYSVDRSVSHCHCWHLMMMPGNVMHVWAPWSSECPVCLAVHTKSGVKGSWELQLLG